MLEAFDSVSGWLQVITIIVLGVFSFITLYERRKKQEKSDTIDNFRATIESMRLRMEEMEKELEEARLNHQDSLQKIARLSGENETLKSLLLGRDPKSIEYQNKSIELLQTLVDELKRHDALVRRAHPEAVID